MPLFFGRPESPRLVLQQSCSGSTRIISLKESCWGSTRIISLKESCSGSTRIISLYLECLCFFADLNLLDWSSNNHVAVALVVSLYLECRPESPRLVLQQSCCGSTMIISLYLECLCFFADLNLLDWSSNNHVAVALVVSLYLECRPESPRLVLQQSCCGSTMIISLYLECLCFMQT